MRYPLIALALVAAACSPSITTESPPLSGHRVQGASIVTQGAADRRLGAHELLFGVVPGASDQAHRAALLVDLAGDQGLVRGFVEWGSAGAAPLTYLVEGWARRRDLEGKPVTVFDLALSRLKAPGDSLDPAAPAAVRVVLNEASGEATLTRRR